jgi:hypothetical protein
VEKVTIAGGILAVRAEITADGQVVPSEGFGGCRGGYLKDTKVYAEKEYAGRWCAPLPFIQALASLPESSESSTDPPTVLQNSRVRDAPTGDDEEGL